MSSFFGLIDPEPASNIVANPSAETTGNFAQFGAATVVTMPTDQARWGIRSYKVAMAGTTAGLFCFLTTAANTTHYASWYAWNTTATMRATMNSGANWNSAAIIGGKTGGWQRYGTAIPPAQASASINLGIIACENVGTLYIDAVQCEANSGYPTTYLDGDMEGLYRWNGLRHASSSTRDAQERSGGKEKDLLDEYGFTVMPTFSGVGMPNVQNNLQSMALQDGALLQSQKTLPREIVLNVNVNAQTGGTWISLHQQRQKLINLVKRDRVRGVQPFTLVYKGADRGAGARNLYAKFVYAGGLEFGNLQNGFVDYPPLRCLAVDPAWYEDNQITQNLTMQQSGDMRLLLAKINGAWSSLTTGVDGSAFLLTVNNILSDPKTNRVYFAGSFTTAGNVTVNSICYWDNGKQIFRAMGATPGIEGGTVYSLARAPDGSIWGAGGFTTAGGAATRGVFKYDPNANAFTTFNTTSSAPFWRSITIDKNSKVYLAGGTTNFTGVSTASFLVSYANNAWSTIPGNPYTTAEYPDAAQALTIDQNNNLIAGSSNVLATTNGAVRKYTGTTWSVIATANTGGDIQLVYPMPDGNILIGGDYNHLNGSSINRLAIYNGSSITPLGSGIDNDVWGATKNSKGLLALVGGFTVAGNLSGLNGLVYHNGSDFIKPDLYFNRGGTEICDVAYFMGDDLFLGMSVSLVYKSSAITNVLPTATENIYPKVTFLGPTTAGTTAGLVWFENQSTDEILYFNQTIQGGEIVTLDLTPNKKTMVSDWRGTIYGQPLSGSDLANFHLLPTTNTIALFMTGQVTTTTSGSAAILQYTPAHHSVDGSA